MKWGPDEVSQWLESVGLPMYCHAFKEHEISGTELLSLERRDFKDVGVTKVRTTLRPLAIHWATRLFKTSRNTLSNKIIF